MKDFPDDQNTLRELITDTFEGSLIGDITDAGRGRGIFSRVVKVELEQAPVKSVIVKAPALGVNGEAGRTSGSYSREALAYRELLPNIAVRTPDCHAVADLGGDPWFVLEDLSMMGTINQLDGIGHQDAQRLGDVLADLHSTKVGEVLAVKLRGPGPARFGLETLQLGLRLLSTKWQTEHRVTSAFERLLEQRDRLIVDFVEAGQETICHGDPRADNVMVSESEVVLLDWQQISMSFGESDLAWLLSTSCTVADRPMIEGSVLSRYAASIGTTLDDVSDRYRLGLTRPGLAVLMLCTRDTSDARTEDIVRESLHRIGHALADHMI